ncbi:permease-like cell division protein FtsX [Streptosporangium sp. NPDC002524]|uniref:permease-like cell division protein FtsX n=1 Tax=Streptosporangium sp. NPDC002524 TaxID=3154537 RepID=UPI00332AE8A9
MNATDPAAGSDNGNEIPVVEELSFGDPEREAPAGKGLRIQRVLLAGVMAVLLLGVAGTAGWYAYQNSARVLPPPDGPWPEGGTFTVFLCKDDDVYERCRKQAITPEQRRSIEERLRAMPEVAEMAFESQETAWANLVNQFADDWATASAFDVDDLPESFKGRLHRRADFESFGTIMGGTPGVSNVAAFGRHFWEGKADISIMLCPPQDAEPDRTEEKSDPCAGRGAATAEEKKAVEARLLALEGIEHVYFENAAHARRVLEHLAVSRDSLLIGFLAASPAPESYFVKLADPGAVRTVVDAVKDMPGVGEAGPPDVD